MSSGPMMTGRDDDNPVGISDDLVIGRWRAAAVCAALGVTTAGVLLRLGAYFSNISLSADEASLARNIVNRTFAGLAKPLDTAQGAPLAYLAAVKAAVLAAGPSEYSLRAVPVIGAVAAMCLLPLIVRRT